MSGLLAALAAYLFWGLLPLFWKHLVHVPPFEIVCHRIIWSCLFMALLLTVMGRWAEVAAVFRDRRLLFGKFLAALFLCINWSVFIWAVTSEYVLEASLGYYICPLMMTLLSRMVFRDTIRPVQVAAILIATVGVLNLVIQYGTVPWVALSLAVLFALYGLINKLAPVAPIPGLFVETLVMGVPASAYLAYLGSVGSSSFLSDGPATDLLLVCAGVVTALPLLGFIFAARRLRLVTIGMCQFIVPTSFFLLGVLVFGETFTRHHLVTFLLIWLGIVLYLVEDLRLIRRSRSMNQ